MVQPTPPTDLPARGLAVFRQALAAGRTARIGSSELWAHFHAAFPTRPRGVEERAWFLAALEEATKAGLITLPPRTGRRWDRTAVPAVPNEVDRIRPAPDRAPEAWRDAVWHEALAWVPGLDLLRPGEETFLRRVHEGLRTGAFRDVVPLKHRSLELTGNEKRLAGLLKGRFFQPGRLSLALLGAAQEVPPLAWTVIRDVPHPRVLVFENAGPTDLMIAMLRAAADPAYDVAVFGGGRPFPSALSRLAVLAPSTLAYVGDLDPDGAAIAASAAKAAVASGLPPLRPATAFHEAMFREAARLGSPDGWPKAHEDMQPRELAASAEAWLGPIATRVAVMVAGGRRIAEEALGPAVLRMLAAGEMS